MVPRLGDKVIVTGALSFVGRNTVTTNTKERTGVVKALNTGTAKDRVDVLLDGNFAPGAHRIVRAYYEHVRSAEA